MSIEEEKTAVRRRMISRENEKENLKNAVTSQEPRAADATKPPDLIRKNIELYQGQLAFTTGYFSILAIASRIESLRPFAAPFYSIQHRIGDGSTAREGSLDVSFVLSALAWQIGMRAVFLYLFTKIAPRCGIHKPKAIIRFAEQSWCLIYYFASFAVGMTLFHNSSFGYSLELMWKDYPHIELDVNVKRFYLVVLAYWIGQLYVLHVEERRKDHYQMFTHHIITCALVIGSYMSYYTRIGVVVMIIMDFVDFTLSLAKVFKYLGFETLCNLTFLTFLVSWVVCRHGIYLYQLWYAYFVATDFIKDNCKSDSFGRKFCFKQNSHDLFGLLMLMLQIISIMWLVMIIRVLVNMLRGAPAEDSRSDDED